MSGMARRNSWTRAGKASSSWRTGSMSRWIPSKPFVSIHSADETIALRISGSSRSILLRSWPSQA